MMMILMWGSASAGLFLAYLMDLGILYRSFIQLPSKIKQWDSFLAMQMWYLFRSGPFHLQSSHHCLQVSVLMCLLWDDIWPPRTVTQINMLNRLWEHILPLTLRRYLFLGLLHPPEVCFYCGGLHRRLFELLAHLAQGWVLEIRAVLAAHCLLPINGIVGYAIASIVAGHEVVGISDRLLIPQGGTAHEGVVVPSHVGKVSNRSRSVKLKQLKVKKKLLPTLPIFPGENAGRSPLWHCQSGPTSSAWLPSRDTHLCGLPDPAGPSAWWEPNSGQSYGIPGCCGTDRVSECTASHSGQRVPRARSATARWPCGLVVASFLSFPRPADCGKHYARPKYNREDQLDWPFGRQEHKEHSDPTGHAMKLIKPGSFCPRNQSQLTPLFLQAMCFFMGGHRSVWQ